MAGQIIYGPGLTFIETSVDESDEQLKAAVNAMIVSIYGRIPKWLTYEFGHRFERKGRNYREFICTAGSVHARLWIYAKKANMARGIIMPGIMGDAPDCIEIRSGIKTEVHYNELRFSPKPRKKRLSK